MKIEKEKVLSATGAGHRNSRQYWPGRDEDDDVDYEALFRSFMEKLFANRGAFKVDGSLLFEFQPKAYVRNEQLISAETAFCFHQFEENGYRSQVVTQNDNDPGGDEYKNSALDSYLYHKKTVPPVMNMEEFLPMI